MKIIRSAERPTRLAPSDKFSGTVYQDEIVVGAAPSTLRATLVSFAPGARTAWHRHSLGQTLYVMQGAGYIQVRGEPAQPIHPGDTVVIPPDVDHWHGARADRLFAHIAMSETVGDGTVWLDLVTDAEYAAL